VGNEAKDGSSKYFSAINGTGTGTKPCKLYDDDYEDEDDDDDDDDDKLESKMSTASYIMSLGYSYNGWRVCRLFNRPIVHDSGRKTDVVTYRRLICQLFVSSRNMGG
jgi:hypothetical protein